MTFPPLLSARSYHSLIYLPNHKKYSEAMLLGKSLGLDPELLATILNTSVGHHVGLLFSQADTYIIARRRVNAGRQKRTILHPELHLRSRPRLTEIILEGKSSL